MNLLMTDVLEHSTDIFLRRLLSQQQVLYPAHCALLPFIGKVVPSTRITVQHRWRFDKLFSILTPFALDRVMRIAGRMWLVFKKLTQTVE